MVEILKARGPLDCLYLDTTFCISAWSNVAIPPKERSVAQIMNLIQQCEASQHVFLECEMLGTEELLLQIASHYQMPISLSQKKFQQIKNVSPELVHVFTTDESQTRFHVCKRHTMENLKYTKGPKPLMIRASTQWFRYCGSLRPAQLVSSCVPHK